MGTVRSEPDFALPPALWICTWPGHGAPRAASTGAGSVVVVGAEDGGSVNAVVGAAVGRGRVARGAAFDAGTERGGGPTTVAAPGGPAPPAPPGGALGGGADPTPSAAAASMRPLPQPAHGTAVESTRCTAPLGL